MPTGLQALFARAVVWILVGFGTMLLVDTVTLGFLPWWLVAIVSALAVAPVMRWAEPQLAELPAPRRGRGLRPPVAEPEPESNPADEWNPWPPLSADAPPVTPAKTWTDPWSPEAIREQGAPRYGPPPGKPRPDWQ